MDEAAYVNKGLFFETIVPLLGMQTAALICISTPLTEMNWFSALLNAKDEDGSLFFNIVRIGLVCKKCMKLSQASSFFFIFFTLLSDTHTRTLLVLLCFLRILY